MCGLTGGWSRQYFEQLAQSLPRMTGALARRGPDDDGHWLDAAAGIALGHRRLAIVDLSPAGHQPMTSASGRWVLAFNGEIYNHLELRAALDESGRAPEWRGHSDTESMLAAIEAWGFEATVRRSTGMFAIALWDRDERALWLARDRLGEKPLYYGWNRGRFLFGSELKALRQAPGFDAPIDRDAIALYLRYNAIPAPYTIHTGCYKLLPGCWLKLDAAALEAQELPAPVSYWSAAEEAARGRANPFRGDERAAADQLEVLLRQAISGQMMADVPLGALLSGGIDSSLVVALMQGQSMQPVRTFSIGFHDEGFDEAQHAAQVAQHLGTQHTELYVSPGEALNIIPDLTQIYDEPFSDSSQIPTCLVSRLTRTQVTVALSGDGGDELFGGYRRYFLSARFWDSIRLAPRSLRRALAGGLTAVPVKSWDRLHTILRPLLPSNLRERPLGDTLHKGAAVLGARDGCDLYRHFVSHWEPEELLPGTLEPRRFGPELGALPANLIEYMMLVDTVHYLPDDILVKVDRAAMSFGLETRVPMLDHRVFEFAWSLPLSYKVRNGTGKQVLRELLYRHVPRKLVDRPKMGFGVPLASWLRGPLKDWAATLLDPARIRAEGFFDPAPITRRWQEHLSGRRNWQYHLWDILIFQAWLESARHVKCEIGVAA